MKSWSLRQKNRHRTCWKASKGSDAPCRRYIPFRTIGFFVFITAVSVAINLYWLQPLTHPGTIEDNGQSPRRQSSRRSSLAAKASDRMLAERSKDRYVSNEELDAKSSMSTTTNTLSGDLTKTVDGSDPRSSDTKTSLLRPNSVINASNLTIIVIGCNRPDGLLQTLNSVKNANVPTGARLHICVDGCGVPEVGIVANEFEWPHGEKIVTLREEPYRLAKHITNCWEDPLPDQWALFVEDDVILAPQAFSAFNEALQIRENHEYRTNIMGIAIHDSRVNQYCWRDRIKTAPCPEIKKACKTKTPTWGHIGSLLCLHGQSHGSWILQQIPSSWGAFYEGKAWAMFKDYYNSRVQIKFGQSLLFNVPHSFSNEWEHSWKRFLLELMFRAGWTLMYRVHPHHNGFAQTLRKSGAHTLANTSKAMIASELQRRCLVSLALDNSTHYTTDVELLNDANRMSSFDYCTAETSMEKLVTQGSVANSFLINHFDTNREKQPELMNSLRVMQQAWVDAQSSHEVPIRMGSDLLSSGYDITFLDKAEVIMVTSFPSLKKDYETTADHFQIFEGLVHFLVASPKTVRLRGNIYGTNVNERNFVNEHGNHLPVIANLLRFALDYAGPNVKWIGIMNGDITFPKNLVRVLESISKSKTCGNPGARCAVLGQRVDVDWNTKRTKLHAEWGMDYFIFNIAGLDFMLQDGVLPPFTVGLVRWDSWLMGFMASSDEINTVDVSQVLKVEHHMNFNEAFSSKTNVDLWNLNIADERFRLGRTDNSNFQVDPKTNAIVPLRDAKYLQSILEDNKQKYIFDGVLERVTNFTYTSGPLSRPQFACLCDLLTILLPGNVTVDSLGQYCAPSNYLAQSRTWDFGNRLYFFNEAFRMLAGITGNELDLNGTSNLTSPAPGVEMSKCCIVTFDSDPPVRIPDKFWTEDAGTKEYKCLVGAYH